MYESGEGVSKDPVLAYMWLHIAALQGNEQADYDKNLLEKEMSLKIR